MAYLRNQGIFCFKVWGSEMMMVGLPDIICCMEGKFIAFETKMPDKRKNLSPKQDYVHRLITAAGGMALVVCSVTEVAEIINKLREHNDR
jgi:Holliday junction resolvase